MGLVVAGWTLSSGLVVGLDVVKLRATWHVVHIEEVQHDCVLRTCQMVMPVTPSLPRANLMFSLTTYNARVTKHSCYLAGQCITSA